jgi:hypothetical protein
MDENEEFEFRLRAEQEASAAPVVPPSTTPAEPSGFARVMGANPIVGAAELGIQGATGALAEFIGANVALRGDPATADKIREAMTYQPRGEAAQKVNAGFGAVAEGVRTLPGVKQLDEAITGAPAPVRDAATSIVGGVNTAIGMTPAGAKPVQQGARKAVERVTDTAVPGAAKPTPDDPVAAMRAAGYKLRPSDVQAIKPGEKVPGQWREGLQEPAKLRKDFTLHNQQVSTKLASEEIGTKDLSASSLEKARTPHFSVYDQVEKAVGAAPSTEFKTAREAALARSGFKPGTNPTTTQVIAALRKQERKRARSEDVATNKEGELDRDAADALESALEKQLTAYGDEKLFKSYQDSRKALARIHDVESATKGQQIDAQRLKRIADRDPGRMVGRLRLIADSAGAAKNVVRHSQNATGRGSSVKAETIYQGVKNLGKSAISKLPGMDVAGSTFQNKFGREALPEERASFADYGRRAPRAEVSQPRPPQLGAGNVEFTGQGGVTPPLANDLAGDLELMPDPVPGAQQLPEAPPMMTADVPPPIRGDIDFQSSPGLMDMTLGELASELGLMPEQPRMPGSIDWQPPVMGDAGNLQTALGLPDELVAQLGLGVDTVQPSLMTPVSEPVPFGPRVELEQPPGRAGKSPAKKPAAPQRKGIDLGKLLAPDET